MIFTPSAGPLGAHPVGYTTKCVVRTTTATVGMVVCTSFTHTNPVTTNPTAVYDPSQGFDPAYAFNCVVPAEGDQVRTGYLGVVTDLNGTNGAAGSIVTVQFGGIANALVTTAAAAAVGVSLELSDGAGILTATGGTGTVPAAVLMDDVAGAITAQLRRVFIPLQYWFRIAI